jgi:hypothetical protein
MLRLQPKEFIFTPSCNLMHATLKIKESRISINRPLRITPDERNKKFLCAPSAIPTDSRLIEIE